MADEPVLTWGPQGGILIRETRAERFTRYREAYPQKVTDADINEMLDRDLEGRA